MDPKQIGLEAAGGISRKHTFKHEQMVGNICVKPPGDGGGCFRQQVWGRFSSEHGGTSISKEHVLNQMVKPNGEGML